MPLQQLSTRSWKMRSGIVMITSVQITSRLRRMPSIEGTSSAKLHCGTSGFGSFFLGCTPLFLFDVCVVPDIRDGAYEARVVNSVALATSASTALGSSLQDSVQEPLHRDSVAMPAFGIDGNLALVAWCGRVELVHALSYCCQPLQLDSKQSEVELRSAKPKLQRLEGHFW